MSSIQNYCGMPTHSESKSHIQLMNKILIQTGQGHTHTCNYSSPQKNVTNSIYRQSIFIHRFGCLPFLFTHRSIFRFCAFPFCVLSFSIHHFAVPFSISAFHSPFRLPFTYNSRYMHCTLERERDAVHEAMCAGFSFDRFVTCNSREGVLQRLMLSLCTRIAAVSIVFCSKQRAHNRMQL